MGTDEDQRRPIALDSREWEEISSRVASTFTPSAPVANRDLFAGRSSQLADLQDATFQVGQHAVIYGERGVGKTSLATWLEAAQKTTRVAIKVNCDSADDFATLWEKAFEEIEFLEQIPSVEFGSAAAAVSRDIKHSSGGEITPNDVRKLTKALSVVAPGTVIYFDEFDRLENKDVRSRMADTIKTLSDTLVPATIVIIGVADTIHELIAEHESVQRALIQVQMPRMRRAELAEILKRGFETIGMAIDESSKKLICTLSQGFPHYTHLLAQAAARHALNDGWLDVVEDDVYTAMITAIRKAQQTITDEYVKATSSARKDAMYADVLLACALAQMDDLGYFAPGDIKGPLRRITNREYDVSAFNRPLTKLSSSERGPALLRKGATRSTRYRFANPMLQPHVIIKGIVGKKVAVSEVG